MFVRNSRLQGTWRPAARKRHLRDTIHKSLFSSRSLCFSPQKWIYLKIAHFDCYRWPPNDLRSHSDIAGVQENFTKKYSPRKGNTMKENNEPQQTAPLIKNVSPLQSRTANKPLMTPMLSVIYYPMSYHSNVTQTTWEPQKTPFPISIPTQSIKLRDSPKIQGEIRFLERLLILWCLGSNSSFHR